MERKNNFENEIVYIKSVEIFNQIINYLDKSNVNLITINNNESKDLLKNKEIVKNQIINFLGQN